MTQFASFPSYQKEKCIVIRLTFQSSNRGSTTASSISTGMWEKQSMFEFSVSALLQTDKKSMRIMSWVIWAQYQGFYSSRGGIRIPVLWAALSSSSLSVTVVPASLQHCWIMSLSMSVYNSTGSSNTPKILRLEISKNF